MYNLPAYCPAQAFLDFNKFFCTSFSCHCYLQSPPFPVSGLGQLILAVQYFSPEILSAKRQPCLSQDCTRPSCRQDYKFAIYTRVVSCWGIAKLGCEKAYL